MADDGMPAPRAGRIEGGRHHTSVRVYFEDTDFSGAVYHASIVRFIERGRSDFLRILGVSHRALSAEGLHFAVRELRVTYHRAARIDDLLDIVTSVRTLTGVRVVLRQDVRRDGEGVADAEVTVVLVDAAGRPRRWPPAIHDALASVGEASRG